MCQRYRITEWIRLEGAMQFLPPSHGEGPFFGVLFPPVPVVHLHSCFCVHFSSDVCVFVLCHSPPQLAESPLLTSKSLLPVLPPASGSCGRWELKIKGERKRGGLWVRLCGCILSPPVAVKSAAGPQDSQPDLTPSLPLNSILFLLRLSLLGAQM